jgi:hypothetical protein
MPQEASRQPSDSDPSSRADSDARPKRPRRGCLVALAIVVLVPLLACLGYWLFSRLAVDAAAQVDQLLGVVHVQRKDELAWSPAQLNQLVWGKDWVRTGESSGARLRFFDVSTADVGPSTEVMVEKLARKRGRNSGSVALKMWSGTVAVRAVRFIDPSSIFRIDTPTASTVVRGARFTVGVEPDGGTNVEVQQGSAEVRVGEETLTLGIGEQLSIGAAGEVERRRVFEPDAALIEDRVQEAWAAPGDTYQVELPEDELNQFLAAAGGLGESPVKDLQIWLADDGARLSLTLVEPIQVDVSAEFDVRVVDGRLVPQVAVGAGGLPVPVPALVLDLALQTVVGQIEGYLEPGEGYVEFSDVQIKDGRIVAVGKKILDK